MIDLNQQTHKEDLESYWMKINMMKKRLEPLVNTKQDLKEYFYEVLEKGKYLIVNKDTAFSNAFFVLIENIKIKLIEYFEKMNYEQTYVYDASQVEVLLGNENKYCYFNHNNKYLNSETFSFSGVASFSTEYLAKGEIFSVIDVVEKFANEVLNISLISGKDLYTENYRCYAMLPNCEMLKVGEISYDFNSCHNIKFRFNFSLIIASLLINSDEKGLYLPTYISPIDVVIYPKNKAKQGSLELCEKIKEILGSYKVVLDDNDDSAGYKSALYDLNGVPFKIIVTISNGEEKIVVCNRYTLIKEEVSIDNLRRYLGINFVKYNKLIFKNNRKIMDKNISLIREGILNENNVNIVPWCGDNCFTKNDDFEYLIPFHQILSSVPCHFCGKINKKFIYIFKKSHIF